MNRSPIRPPAKSQPTRDAAPCGSPWDITMPAELDSPRPSQPFEEPLRGMAIREVIEPQVFTHFFGKPAR